MKEKNVLSEEEKNEAKHLNKMNDQVRDSLSFEQRKEVIRMYKRINPKTFYRHLINIRFSFWFIKKWYIVFLLGLDRKGKIKKGQASAQNKVTTLLINIMIYIIVILGILAFVLISLYILKSVAGINLFPNKHLSDLI